MSDSIRHTCMLTGSTYDGGVPPPCAACQQQIATRFGQVATAFVTVVDSKCPACSAGRHGFCYQGSCRCEACKFDWESAAKELWVLLDDIDMLGDSMHPETNEYFTRVNAIAEKRHRILHSDGHALKSWPPPAPPPGPTGTP